jgi:hypothetical protein
LNNIFVERLWRSFKYEEVHLKAAGGRAVDDPAVLDDRGNLARPLPTVSA